MHRGENRFLDFLSRLPVRFYWLILPMFLILVILSLLSLKKFMVKLSFLDELPPNHPLVVRYREVSEKYGGVDMIFFIIQSQNLKELKRCAEGVESGLKNMEEIKSVRGKLPVDFIKHHALYFVEKDNLDELADFLKRREKEFSAIFEDLDFLHFIRKWSELMESEILQREDVGDEEEFVESITNIRNWLNLIDEYFKTGYIDEERYRSFFKRAFLIGTPTNSNTADYDVDHEYMISKDLDTIAVFAIPIRPADDYGFNSVLYKKLLGLKSELENGVCSGEKLYLGGTYVALEQQRLVTVRDMRVTTIIASVGATLLFLMIFRGIGGMIVIGITIGVGLILTFGFLMITYGYVTIISALFGAFLIGLGIDFPSYVFSRWKELIEEEHDPKDAVYLALKSTITPMFIGVITTSSAFYSVTISEITGNKILGFIAGSGVIIYLITAIFFTSSLIVLLGKFLAREKSITLDTPLRFVSKTISRFPIPFLSIYLLFVLLGIYGVSTKFGFEHNLRKILPDLPAIHAEDKIVEEFNRPKDYTVFVFDNLEELDEKIKEIEKKSTVRTIESIRLFYPSDISEKIPVVQSVYEVVEDISLGKKPEIPSVLPSADVIDAFEKLKRVSSALIQLAILSGTFEGEDEAKKLQNQIQRIIDELSGKGYVDLTTLQIINADVVSEMLEDLKLAARSRGFTLNDIPQDIRRTFVGKDGSFIVYVYPNRVIWEDENYMRLIRKEMEEVDPKSFSIISMFLSVTDRVKKDFFRALLFATFLVVFWVFLGFRNVKYTALAMLPVASALLITSGILSLLGMKIHYINMGAYALLLGCGVDYGVHMIHRIIEEKGNVARAISGTGRAIFIAASTTVVGFSSMLAANFPGLKDLGEILSVGIIFSLLLAVFLVPSFVSFLVSKKILKFEEKSEI